MLVKILRGFPCAIDALGIASRDLVAGSLEDVRSDLIPGRMAEGYVASPAAAHAAANAEMAAMAETHFADPLDHDGDGRKGGSLKGGNRRKTAA